MEDDDRVFRALADPTRRFLLDVLFLRDGQTLTELEQRLEMSRFGVVKHLKVLEEAGLVVTRKDGREKFHEPTSAAEPMTTLTWEITPSQGGSRLTLTHDRTGAPATEHMVSGALEDEGGQGGGGWSWVLSDLTSLLETGSPLGG